MKIRTERKVNENGELVFTITVPQPDMAEFSPAHQSLLAILDKCQGESMCVEGEDKIKEEIIRLVHAAKDKTFQKFILKLTFHIRNSLEPKFQHICQEVYNWIYDAQSGDLKEWMQTFDPQRTKYYFDNDKTIEDDEDDEDGD